MNLVQSADSVGSGQQQPHGHGGHGPESLLGVTKKLATRVKSSVQTVIPAPAPGGVSPEQELEVGMARAREGAEALREIVMPLEEQIVALKGKLRETDGLLQEYERRQAVSLLEMEAVAAWLAASGEGEAGQGEARQRVEARLVAEVGEGYSGGEGELHHAMLAARIGMLVQQLDTVTWARDQAARDLEAERRRGQADRDKAERLAGVAAVTREQLSRVRSQLTDQQKEQLGALWSEETQQTTASSSVGERVQGHQPRGVDGDPGEAGHPHPGPGDRHPPRAGHPGGRAEGGQPGAGPPEGQLCQVSGGPQERGCLQVLSNIVPGTMQCRV